MSDETLLPKAYEPKSVESKWYAAWKAAGVFHAEPDPNKEPYCITIPPPNITGSLHMGHALNNSVLDAMTRWHRMRGFAALCLPGTDHAGIGLQNVVERELAKEGLTRHDLGREAFIERCWQWREQYGTRIYYQFEKLGCSYDWERARFTLDETYVDAVMEEFGRWFERGLIYRGNRIVNWDIKFQTAVSDIEVETKETQGKLYHFRYPFADGSGHITIATTRPETLFGDSAVAANPADARYQPLFGKMLRLPLTDREIPLIADDYAKPEFGSGAVKVTPAHDLNDFEAGQRHNLPQPIVIGKDGKMTDLAGPDYAGLDRYAARKKVVADMETLGLLDKIEDYTIQQPISERSKEVIEPLLSEQWFVDMKPLAAPAIDVVKTGQIRFIPDRYEGIYLHWMENIRDWCISRQLWWGHRIPVWWTEGEEKGERKKEKGEDPGATEASANDKQQTTNNTVREYGGRRFVFARTREEAVAKLGAEDCRQDEDVLDTWFSSALWPHATLGWPRDTADLRYFYPTNLLSTAQEILYLWVARMVMTGLDFLGEVPFRDVYIHATVLDEQGRRMSKTLGNGIDPIDLIEKYGADATRFSLLGQAGKNQDIKYSEQRTELAGNFCNKLWNASRFVLMSLEETEEEKRGRREEERTNPAGVAASDTSFLSLPPREEQTSADRWILSQLRDTIEIVNARLGSYDVDDATRALYNFFWNDFCDWYVEMAKPRLRGEGAARRTAQNMLAYVLETTLRLLHPLMPFITEEIWQALTQEKGERRKEKGEDTGNADTSDNQQSEIGNPTICLASYPQAEGLEAWKDPDACQAIAYAIAATRTIRNLRVELSIAPGVRLTAAIVTANEAANAALRETGDLIVDLARLEAAPLFLASAPTPENGQNGKWIGTPGEDMEVFLEIGDAMDMDKERARIQKELDAVAKEIERSQAKLGNAGFVARAKPEVVDEERGRLLAWQDKQSKLEERARLFAPTP